MLLTSYETNNTNVKLSSSGDNQILAQKIQTKRDAEIQRAIVNLAIAGTPGGYAYVSVYSDDSGPDSQISNGRSDPILCSAITAGWTTFDFPEDDRPQISAETNYYIILNVSSSYSDDASNYLAWKCDQTTPFYIDGSGYQNDGSSWAEISTDTDFNFKVHSGSRDTVYSSLRDIEAQMPSLTDNTTGKFDSGTNPSIYSVMDFEDNTSDMIDGWLKSAGISTPISDSSIGLIRQYANDCVSLRCELTRSTAGFRTQGGDTRLSALRKMCNDLRNDLEENGPISKAIKDEEGLGGASNADAFSAGYIEDDDRDDYRDDTDLIQPLFKNDMWDNE